MPKGVYQRKYKPVSERFARHFTKGDGCWEWNGVKTQYGYGVVRVHEGGMKQLMAHRVSWELFVGPIPDGLCVLHKCDNPPCVNPDHLFVGTREDNVNDMIDKGRSAPFGRVHWNRRLPEQERIAIAQAIGTEAGVAKQFGVSQSHVHRLRKRYRSE